MEKIAAGIIPTSLPFSNISNKPTTLQGYGISDFPNKSCNYVVEDFIVPLELNFFLSCEIIGKGSKDNNICV